MMMRNKCSQSLYNGVNQSYESPITKLVNRVHPHFGLLSSLAFPFRYRSENNTNATASLTYTTSLITDLASYSCYNCNGGRRDLSFMRPNHTLAIRPADSSKYIYSCAWMN